MNPTSKKDSDFRDHIATADKSGKRIWVFPTKPKGKLHTARLWVSWFLLFLLFGGPFMKINSQPILLLDVIHRKFIILGEIFWPQDFHLFVLFAISIIIIVFLFTAVFGRLFCGWVCPQTIFLEMVFRKIEYFIEGSAARQKELSAAPWSATKFFKKFSKHLIFYMLSFFIGNTFLAYIIGIEELQKLITDPPSQHTTGLVVMIIFSGMFYWVFAWFREQACTLVCPYGRLQSVMLDPNSIVVAYDYKRGEPRKPMGRQQNRENLGDCIDCDACVKVCPTGIDIRNGTQLECVNCTACIDACNFVMKKVKLPQGLIRYSSLNNIEYSRKFSFTPRLILYSIALFFIITLTTIFLFNRTDVETSILRTPGQLFIESDQGIIKNLYNIKVVNKTYKRLPIEIHLKSIKGDINMIGDSLIVSQNDLAETVFFIEIDKKFLFSKNQMIVLEIISGDEVIEEVKTNFMGPDKRKN